MKSRLHATQFGPPASSIPELFWKLGIGGVCYPGRLYWDSFPQLEPDSIIASSTINTDGVASPIVEGDDIDTAFWVTHLTHVTDGASGGRLRFSLYDGNKLRRAFRTTPRDEFEPMPQISSITPWYYAQPGVPIFIKLASTIASAETFAYLQVFRGNPLVVPEFLRTVPSTETIVHPPGVVVGSRFGTKLKARDVWSEYDDLNPTLNHDFLITEINITMRDDQHVRIAMATGERGEEIDWGYFAIPADASADANDAVTLNFNLWPFPFFLPRGVRLKTRMMRHSTFVTSMRFTPNIGVTGLKLGGYS